MIPVTQSRTGDTGTCFRASLASILNLHEDQVPDFGEANEDPGINTFLSKYGLRYQEVPVGNVAPVGYHIITGISPRGGMHAVVGLNGQIVWDPHPIDGSSHGLSTQEKYGLLLPVAKDSRAEAETLRQRHDELKSSTARMTGGEPAYRALLRPTTELIKEAERLLAKTRTDDQPYWNGKVESARKYLATAEKNAGLRNWGQSAAYLDAALTFAHTVIDKLRHTGRAKDMRLDRYSMAQLLDTLGIDIKEYMSRTEAQKNALLETAMKELDRKTGRAKDARAKDSVPEPQPVKPEDLIISLNDLPLRRKAKDSDPRDGVTKCQACGVGLMGDDVLKRGGKVICPECAAAAVRRKAKDAGTVPPYRQPALPGPSYFPEKGGPRYEVRLAGGGRKQVCSSAKECIAAAKEIASYHGAAHTVEAVEIQPKTYNSKVLYSAKGAIGKAKPALDRSRLHRALDAESSERTWETSPSTRNAWFLERARQDTKWQWAHWKDLPSNVQAAVTKVLAPKVLDRSRLHRALDAVMDAAQYELRKSHSQDLWAVFKVGDDVPESGWTSKAKALTTMRTMNGGAAPRPSPLKRTKEEPDIMGYPWEIIQAAQQGKIRGSQMGAHAAAVRQRRGY